ncbi:hypothetical protein M885DRAFT_546264 [Pelagophyceae sp. CCMP2097]|nr:hypothetical protein M885DRAFT_546264 [Pelagophyceae sp. CCMP2097]
MREVAALLELDVASLCVLVAQRDGVLKSLRKEQVVSVVLRRCDAYTNRGKKAPWLDGFFARLNEAYDGG